jgi:hypothetical protein
MVDIVADAIALAFDLEMAAPVGFALWIIL